ncbi:MAG TPA: hypothetical protein VNE67_09190 [Acetobacteraceae bacterium]|nr:hypothetical protein [Acetobacteraceae bacterium]
MKGVPNLPLPAGEVLLPGPAAGVERAPSAAAAPPPSEGADALAGEARGRAISPAIILLAKNLVEEALAAQTRLWLQLAALRDRPPDAAPEGQRSLAAGWCARIQARLDAEAPGQWLALADAADFAARRFRLVPLVLAPAPLAITLDPDPARWKAA